MSRCPVADSIKNQTLTVIRGTAADVVCCAVAAAGLAAPLVTVPAPSPVAGTVSPDQQPNCGGWCLPVSTHGGLV
jgi:hypothetical protein